MFTKTPKVTSPRHGAPKIAAIKKATNNGLKVLKQAAIKVPKRKNI
jgi:hypothetical protein